MILKIGIKSILSTTKRIQILCLIALIFIASACYYDSEEYLFPVTGSQCDTSNVTFSASVKPVLQADCYACHSNATSSFGNNIRLENYADVKISVNDGTLIGSITYASGYAPMPPGGLKLTSCKISIIRKWIESGAPDN